MISLLVAMALAGDSMPPQVQQVTSVGDGGTIPVVCVAGCGSGSGSGSGGGGASWDAGVLVQNPVMAIIDGGLVVFVDGGFVQATQGPQALYDAGWPVILTDDLGAPLGVVANPLVTNGSEDAGVYLLPGSVVNDVLWDGGVVVQNWPAVQGVSFPGDGGVVTVYVVNPGGSTYISQDGGTLAVVETGQLAPLAVVTDGGTWDAGFLAYTYGGPLPADTSAQSSGSSGVTLCGTAGTALGLVANAKNQVILNDYNSPTTICVGYVAGLSCPPAIDAGTTLGTPVLPGGTYVENGGVQLYCVSNSVAQTTADAGTYWIDSK